MARKKKEIQEKKKEIETALNEKEEQMTLLGEAQNQIEKILLDK